MITNDKVTLETTENSLQILELIKDTEGAKMTTIAEEIGLSQSTVHTHLTTLRKHGYVTRKGEYYYLGIKLYHIGVCAKHRNPIYELAKERTIELSERTGEEVDFNIEENGRLTTIYQAVNGSIEREPSFQSGHHYYLHTASVGKAILAELPDNRVDQIIDYWGLPKRTEHTITEREELLDELETIRDRGYAIGNQEHRLGLRTVGAAIKNPDGSIFGGIAVDSPTYRMQNDNIEDIAEIMLEIVDELESDTESSWKPESKYYPSLP